ncbi:SPOR domain-containing protein [Falsigemmobacter faecalis]|uniref:SPOR domain-containing protein n=1 Tax=Falsigemmobacter faecalis TaxID=2488730 RepID=A0A3P3DU03_9RHOB|nr:SPOR domain-containing protein [Falsigemmobacter faecalis]RRH76932.1 SPOR domain-containing protein [Falsigemmobacter faecalis]
MFIKSLPAAIAAAMLTAGAAAAQSRPPAEAPPAGYAGQQYVDSRGCVYVRAGHGGQVNWVARIDRARRAICGQTPSLTEMAQARAALNAPAPAVAPAVIPAAPPVAAVAAAPAAVRAPRTAPSRQQIPAADYVPPPVTYGAPRPLAAAPAAPRAVAPAPAPAPVRLAQRSQPPATIGGHPTMVDRRVGCPAQTPHAVWYELQDGRKTLLCSNKPHSLQGVRPTGAPGVAVQPAPVQPRAVAPAAAGRGYVDPPLVGGTGYRVSYPQRADLMTPPPGYKSAWSDDRLNPNRGPRSAEGNAAMARVWTEQTPQELRSAEFAQPAQSRVSSRGTPATVPVAAAAGGRFVQIGSFAQRENAGRAVARLQGMGLPVQVGRTTLRGKPVQVVSAGPFASPQEAAQALNALRAAGYGDAVLRR